MHVHQCILLSRALLSRAIFHVTKCSSSTKITCACSRHTSRFLLWWLTGFPFAAWSSYGWFTPCVTAVVTFLLLGVENIGIQIEEPFEVLPIESITAACVASVHEIMERHMGKLLAL